MLNKENCRGIWCGIDIPWNKDYSFNDKRFAYDCAKMCEAGVPGIYTTGSSGEWHALDFNEFKYLVDIFADVMKGKKILSVVGCHLNTRDAMKKMDYVAGKGTIDGIQFAFPSWMKMSESECYDYVDEICYAYPKHGFWHYNTERSKVIACATAMALGISVGGWKIIKTMGVNMIKLQPINGFAAETGSALVIEITSSIGAPVSTTHVISSSIMGVGASKRLSSVRGALAKNM